MLYKYLANNKNSRKELIEAIFKSNEDEFQKDLEKELFKLMPRDDDNEASEDEEYDLDQSPKTAGRELMDRLMKTGTNFNTRELEKVLEAFKHPRNHRNPDLL